MVSPRRAAWCVPEIPELTSPAALGATAVLVVNDHLLKETFPGFVTGKASDLAGCFVLPLFVSAALAFSTRLSARRRLGLGVATTVLVFGAMKLYAPFASGVAAALDLVRWPLGLGPGRILADPTDLLALPLAAVAYVVGLGAVRTREEERRERTCS